MQPQLIRYNTSLIERSINCYCNIIFQYPHFVNNHDNFLTTQLLHFTYCIWHLLFCLRGYQILVFRMFLMEGNFDNLEYYTFPFFTYPFSPFIDVARFFRLGRMVKSISDSYTIMIRQLTVIVSVILRVPLKWRDKIG